MAIGERATGHESPLLMVGDVVSCKLKVLYIPVLDSQLCVWLRMYSVAVAGNDKRGNEGGGARFRRRIFMAEPFRHRCIFGDLGAWSRFAIEELA